MSSPLLREIYVGQQCLYHDANNPGQTVPAVVLRAFYGISEYDYTVDAVVLWPGGYYETLTGVQFRWFYPTPGQFGPSLVRTYIPDPNPEIPTENYVQYTVTLPPTGEPLWVESEHNLLNIYYSAYRDPLPALPDERYLPGATYRVPGQLTLQMNTARYICTTQDTWQLLVLNAASAWWVPDEGMLTQPPSAGEFTAGQTMDVPCIFNDGGGA